MRLNKKSTSKKFPISAAIVVLVVASIYFSSAYAFHFWPFPTLSSNTTSPDKNKPNDSPPDTQPGDNNEGEPSTNPDNIDTGINPPLQNQPSNTEPYPIENERYRIVKNGEKSFDVTLYPIVNNPEYSDYTEQLKAYKNDVMAYLKGRYGSVDNLSINWSPANAKNL